MADDGKVAGRIKALRARWPWFDHLMAMNERYGEVQGSVLAGGVTYFGFLSFFPILALGFAVVGFVSIAYPDARDSMVTAIEQVLPGIVSADGSSGTISLDQIESAKAAAGLVGFAGVLYSGLGWLSGLRAALETSFAVPKAEKPNFVIGKAVDLLALAAIGVILILSVSVAGVVKGLADQILEAITLDDNAIGKPLVWAVGIALGLAASTVLFYVMYRLLGKPEMTGKPLWQGALLGAAGFEVLKVLVVNVFGSVGGSAFAPLAIAITLVVWINYFSRLVLYGAAWAMTAPDVIEARRHVRPEVAASAVEARVRAGVADDDDEDGPRGRLDPGSAVLGAIAGFVAARLLGRDL